MTEARITHIGGPTTLIEAGGWTLLTDPTFDPPGRRYSFGWGTASRKEARPAVRAADLPFLDAVLLTHDHHADNLDDAGRTLLASAGTVITTVAGGRRLGAMGGGGRLGPVAGGGGRLGATGLAPWTSTTLAAPGRPTIRVTATPCRHGPPLSGPITGEVAGFGLEWEGQEHGALWISGDTVLYDGVRAVPSRLNVGTVLLHLGAVQFGLTGPLRYTMTGRDGVELCELLGAQTILPVHYEGWSHFHEGRAGIEQAFAAAPPSIRDSVHWLTPGKPAELTV